jgi:N4-gp56 family major capsid protein
MDELSLINNTSVYRNPAPQSPLQGQNVMQPAAVYSKIMLRTIELAESDYTFDGLAVERIMPSNNGSNEIVFKRMLSLAAHTQPLVEGIPPASDQGRMVAIKATTNSYGRVMKFTDKVNWAVVDSLI